MRTALENRLAAAEKLRHDFECEKRGKEESAILALRKEEALMERVVQESKRLEAAAEENTKVITVSCSIACGTVLFLQVSKI